MWKKKQTEEPKNKDITRESYLQTVFRRFRRHHLAAVSLVILVILGGAALLAPVIAPYDPDAIVGSFSGAPNLQFWLGTDQIGRDVFSRLLAAGQRLLTIIHKNEGCTNKDLAKFADQVTALCDKWDQDI